MKKIIFTLFVGLLFIGWNAFGQTTVMISPINNETITAATVTLQVQIENVVDLHAISVTVVFDKSILRYESATKGDFLPSNNLGYSIFFFTLLKPAASPDTILVDQAILGKAAVSGSGVIITLKFTALQAGKSDIKVINTDLRNLTNNTISATTSSSKVNVLVGTNKPPSISYIPSLQVDANQQFSYKVQASDPDGDVPIYKIATGPSFLTINSSTGDISGTPSESNIGVHSVTVRAEDGKGGSAEQTFSLEVMKINHAPSLPILLSPNDGEKLQSSAVTLQWSKSIDPDQGDYVSYSVRISSFNFDTTFKNLKTETLTLSKTLLAPNKLYMWYVESSDGKSTVRSADVYSFKTPVSTGVMNKNSTIPTGLIIQQNYPNPFLSTTNVTYTLYHKSHLRIEIYNSIGALTATLTDESKDEGTYSINWNGRDSNNRIVPSGKYTGVFSTISERKSINIIVLH